MSRNPYWEMHHEKNSGTAVGIVEFLGIAEGIKSLDYAVKNSDIHLLRAGMICPGGYLLVLAEDMWMYIARSVCCAQNIFRITKFINDRESEQRHTGVPIDRRKYRCALES